jgi:hypothetical protein
MTDTDHDKIIRTEEKVDALSKVVYEIKDNHLQHLAVAVEELRSNVQSINVKLGLWSGGIMVGVWLIDRFLK